MRLLSIALLLLLLGISGISSSAPPSREAELAALRGEISRLERELARTRQAESGLAGNLARSTLELQLQEKRLAEAVAARELTLRQAAASEAEVARLEDELETARADLARRMSGLYRLGRQGYARLFLSLQFDSRFLPSVRLLRFLVQRDREVVDRYTATRRELGRERDRLIARRQEIETWVSQEEGRRTLLARVRSRQAALLAQTSRQNQDLAARAGELAERERRLAVFLDALGRQGEGDGLSGQPMRQFRGLLDWPAQGPVTTGFGPQLDPRYRTQVPHNGVDIATAPASEVRAVFPGRVLFAAPFEGYGTTVVVSHAGRALTLYAGLSELRVRKEDVVSLDQVVGLASERLYFEVRVENRPEDPVHWFR